MKKILFSLLMLFGLTAAWAGTDDGNDPQFEGYIPVTTAAELQTAIRNDISAKVHLCADIDVSGIGKIRDTFKGTISGVYSKVDPETNTTVKASHVLKGRNTHEHDGDRLQLHLFDNVDGATFENIVFTNFMVHADDDNLGVIAKTASNSNFKNLIFDSCSMFNNDDYVGVVAGTASNCNFENVTMQKCDVTTDALYAGAIVGQSDHCKFKTIMCGTCVYVFADGGGSNAYSGGITGYSVNDNFEYCVHMGLVGANDDYVGGMAGRSKDSHFLSCSNAATVAHCQGEKFSEIQEQREEELKKLDEITLKTMFSNIYVGGATTIVSTGVFGIASYLCYISEATELLSEYAFWSGMEGLTLEALGGAPVASPFIGYALPAIMLGLTAWYVYYEATGDSYAGGIVGLAENGTIEQCANFGLVNSVKSFVGGIVGDASGVVINNCLNAATVHQDRDNHWIDGPWRVGGIIGRGRDNTKVTNCLTNNGYPINGSRDPNERTRLDQASGNNFSIGRTDHDADCDFLEASVNEDLVKNGLVAYWLNNGVENREKGIKPWHQNLWSRQVDGQEVKRDAFPILDASHDEVNADLFYDARNRDPEHIHYINDANGLQIFADAVNGGNEYAIGFLEKDIDMTNQNWFPIGKDEDHKHFRGLFDGRGHKITGLTCTRTDEPVGLFGAAFAGAVIRNVTIGEDCSFTSNGEKGAGGILGKVYLHGRSWGTVVIENCSSYADINVGKHGGGILGHVDTPNDNTTIKVFISDCYSSGTVTAVNGNSALLCGYSKNNGYVTNCWSAGQLRHYVDPNGGKTNPPFSAKNSKDESNNPEYLVGYDDKLFIENCYILKSADNIDDWIADKVQNGVVDIAEDKLATGEFTYMLGGNKGHWQQNLGKDLYPVPGDKGLYHTRTVSNQYGTVCLPYPLKSDDDIKYYELKTATTTADGEVKLQFQYAETVSPGTPVVFAAANGEVTFNDVNYMNPAYIPADFALSVETGEGDWKMHSHPFEKVFEGEEAKTVYYLTGDKIKNAKKTTVAPYHAYFRGPSIETLTAAGAKAISIVLEDEDGMTTGLEFVGEELVPVQQGGKAYTIMGTEASEGYRGIVIKNGKKVLQTAKP